MKIRIRDWEKHFERDRSKQWKTIKWVPIPNKQGCGYKKIMAEKNGLEIFACWIALVEQGSLCDPRGDLSKYSINELSILTLIKENILKTAIIYLSQVIDWIEVIENLDKNVNDLDKICLSSSSDSSILSNSVLSNSSLKNKSILDYKKTPPTIEEVIKYFVDNGYPEDLARRCYEGYAAADWRDSKGNPVRSWKQKAQHVWFKPEAKIQKKETQIRKPEISDFYKNLKANPMNEEQRKEFHSTLPEEIKSKMKPIKSGEPQKIAELL